MQENFRTKVDKVQQDYLQQERAEQAREFRLIEQERQRQRQAAKPQPKPVVKAPAIPVNTDTRYTETLQHHLGTAIPDASARLRQGYMDTTPAVNSNRATRSQQPNPVRKTRSNSPTRRSYEWLNKAGREIANYTPDVIKGGVNLMLKTVGSDIAWVAQQFPRTSAVVSGAFKGVDYVTSEAPNTYTRRTLRDEWGMDPFWAQVCGDAVGGTAGVLIPAKAVQLVVKAPVVTKVVTATTTAVNNAARATKAALYALDKKAVSTFDRYMATYSQKVPVQGINRGLQPKVYNPNSSQALFSKSHDAGKGPHTIPPQTQATSSTSIPQTALSRATDRNLDWFSYNAEQHIYKNHTKVNLQKQNQGVFFSDPKTTIDQAWTKVQRDKIQPCKRDGRDHYIVPYDNCGHSAGYGDQIQKLDYVTIVVDPGTKKLITAYPSGRTLPFSKNTEYQFFNGGQ